MGSEEAVPPAEPSEAASPPAPAPAAPDLTPVPDAPAPPEPTAADDAPVAADAPSGSVAPLPGKRLDLSRSKLAGQAPASAPPAAAERPALAVPGPGTEVPEEEPAEAQEPADWSQFKRTLEALLFAAEEPVSVRDLARAVAAPGAAVRRALTELHETYEEEGRPWELAALAGGFRLMTRAEFYTVIQKLRAQRAQKRLSQAALETLALIAYSKTPIGRAEIEAVRGVDTGPVLRQLLDRKLIRIAGRAPGLGAPLLYAVSYEFLEHFGLNSTQDLPQPGELKKDEE